MSGLSLHNVSSLSHKAPGLVRLMAKWLVTRRTRTALARLDMHMLEDIGLEPGRAAQEAQRPFWSL